MDKRKNVLIVIAFSALGFLSLYFTEFANQPYYHSGLRLSLFADGFHILAVAPDSPAEAGGLRSGMTITTVNSIDAIELFTISERDMGAFLTVSSSLFEIGKTMEITTAAGEEIHFTISVMPWIGRFRLLTWTVVYDIAIGLCFILLGIWLFAIGREKTVMTRFLLFTVGAGLALALSYFISYWSMELIVKRFIALDLTGIVACVSLIGFARRFPDSRPLRYPLALIASVVVLGIKYLFLQLGWLKPFGVSVYFIHLYLIVSITYAIGLLIGQYRRSGSEGRIRLRWVFAGTASSLVPYLVYTVSLVMRSRILTNGHSAINAAASFSLLSFPIFVGVGVIKYKLFDIDRFINRFAVLVIMGVAATALFLAASFFVPGSRPSLESYLAFLATTLIAPGVYAALKGGIAAFFARRYKDENQILLELEQELVGVYQTEAIYSIVSAALVSAFNPSSIAFIRSGRDSKETLYRFISEPGSGDTVAKSFSLNKKGDEELRLAIGRRRNDESYTKEDVRLLSSAAAQISKVLDNCRLHDSLEDSLANESVAQRATILTLAKLTEYRDQETGRHLERLREYARLLAQRMKDLRIGGKYVTDEYIKDLCLSSILHDIGKVGVPDRILRKPGKLTIAEFEVMKQHTQIGGKVLEEAEAFNPKRSFLAIGKTVAYHHHERWDGSGYPFGLKAEDIPLSARIVAIADVYDALRSDRSYKRAVSHEVAVEQIKAGQGSHFDPSLVDAFMSIEPQVRAVLR